MRRNAFWLRTAFSFLFVVVVFAVQCFQNFGSVFSHSMEINRHLTSSYNIEYIIQTEGEGNWRISMPEDDQNPNSLN